jgi:hypothetical protein
MINKEITLSQDQFPQVHSQGTLISRGLALSAKLKEQSQEKRTSDIDDIFRGTWPMEWPTQRFVNLNNMADPWIWIEDSLGEPISEVLSGNIAIEPIVHDMAIDYLNVCLKNGYPLPCEFRDNPAYGIVTDEDITEIEAEFSGFFQEWRERAQEQHRREQFYRGIRPKLASILASMPPMASVPDAQSNRKKWRWFILDESTEVLQRHIDQGLFSDDLIQALQRELKRRKDETDTTSFPYSGPSK